MRGNIEEQIFVLRCRIFWAMRSWIGEYHEDGPIRLGLFGSSKKCQGVIGDDIREIILSIVPTVPDLVPIDVEGVIVEAGVAHQPVPLVPARRDVVAIVLVEVFAEVACRYCC